MVYRFRNLDRFARFVAAQSLKYILVVQIILLANRRPPNERDESRIAFESTHVEPYKGELISDRVYLKGMLRIVYKFSVLWFTVFGTLIVSHGSLLRNLSITWYHCIAGASASTE
jgi:hypothetical protein